MDADIENIIATLKQTYGGEAWHGPSVAEALRDVGESNAFNRLPDTHSIIELVAHMTAWRLYVIKKLEGDAAYNVSDEQNFPASTDWQATLKQLEDSQQQLISSLEKFRGNLRQLVPGREKPLSFYKLLHGIIHHDLYHAGQIVLIRKATREQSF